MLRDESFTFIFDLAARDRSGHAATKILGMNCPHRIAMLLPKETRPVVTKYVLCLAPPFLVFRKPLQPDSVKVGLNEALKSYGAPWVIPQYEMIPM